MAYIIAKFRPASCWGRLNGEVTRERVGVTRERGRVTRERGRVTRERGRVTRERAEVTREHVKRQEGSAKQHS